MLRRLTFIASVVVLAGCSSDSNLPTGVSLQQVPDENPTTVPPGLCDITTNEQSSTLIPLCVDGPEWPGGTEFRARHTYENVRVTGGGVRGGNRLF